MAVHQIFFLGMKRIQPDNSKYVLPAPVRRVCETRLGAHVMFSMKCVGFLS